MLCWDGGGRGWFGGGDSGGIFGTTCEAPDTVDWKAQCLGSGYRLNCVPRKTYVGVFTPSTSKGTGTSLRNRDFIGTQTL